MSSNLRIAATGHRPGKLGGHRQPVYDALRELAEEYFSEENPSLVITGMALGWDIAIAQAAAQAGADVTLIAANIDSTTSGLKTIRVETALEMKAALESVETDVLVMTAAVADYRVAAPSETKLKKSALGENLTLELVANPDLLADIQKPGLFKVGFAAETSSHLEQLATQKLASKGCDLLVANDVSGGAVFGQSENKVLVVDRAGAVVNIASSKTEIAKQLIDIIATRLS